MTSVPGIDKTNIDAEFCHCHMRVSFSNNFHEVPDEQCFNHGAGDRGSGGKTVTRMCHIHVVLAQHYFGIINSICLLIDKCYTSSVGKNPDMFKNL